MELSVQRRGYEVLEHRDCHVLIDTARIHVPVHRGCQPRTWLRVQSREDVEELEGTGEFVSRGTAEVPRTTLGLQHRNIGHKALYIQT